MTATRDQSAASVDVAGSPKRAAADNVDGSSSPASEAWAKHIGSAASPSPATAASSSRIDSLISVALERAVDASKLLRAVGRVLDEETAALREQGFRDEAHATAALARDVRRIAGVRAMVEAAQPFLGAEWALEVSANVAQIAVVEDNEDLVTVARAAIRHRIGRLCMAPLADDRIAECAGAMAEAWRLDR